MGPITLDRLKAINGFSRLEQVDIVGWNIIVQISRIGSGKFVHVRHCLNHLAHLGDPIPADIGFSQEEVDDDTHPWQGQNHNQPGYP